MFSVNYYFTNRRRKMWINYYDPSLKYYFFIIGKYQCTITLKNSIWYTLSTFRLVQWYVDIRDLIRKRYYFVTMSGWLCNVTSIIINYYMIVTWYRQHLHFRVDAAMVVDCFIVAFVKLSINVLVSRTVFWMLSNLMFLRCHQWFSSNKLLLWEGRVPSLFDYFHPFCILSHVGKNRLD